jgi:hypothetical protein
MMWGLGAAAGLAILVMLLFLFWSPSDVDTGGSNVKQPVDQPVKQPVQPAVAPVAPQAISISMDVRPWAEIEIKGNGLSQPMRNTTPVRVNLPPGEYSVVISNPDFPSFTRTIQVNDSNRDFRFEFPQLDPNQVVERLLR